jgi:hypothetical protein
MHYDNVNSVFACSSEQTTQPGPLESSSGKATILKIVWQQYPAF